MTYQILVPNIHCSGCCKLLKLVLEDFFRNIEVDQDQKVVKFASDDTTERVDQKLAIAFKELTSLGYTFESLHTL